MPKRTPEELLEVLNRSEETGRGKLRIFLGMCPGVGKTFSMLEAAQQQLRRGINVVVGVVETHGRKETEELLEGLTVIPKKSISYKNTDLKEMDIDQILKIKPVLVLVDELAHTNVPGSRHSKRHQDVQELLNAGIDVYTTVNIQHIESRNDQVAQITGVQVRETVPDSFFEIADQISVVDLPPNELLQRLKEGKVYLGDRAARAIEGFFKEEHLLALRELALRFVAERVDQDLHDQMAIKGIEGPWNTNERLLVAISHSPSSSRLIRTTRRMAFSLEAPWIALYVNTGKTLSAEDQDNLQKNISLARSLGAEVITLLDQDVAHAIQKIAQDKNVTQIVIGRPERKFLRDIFFGGTLLDQLVEEVGKVDVHVIRTKKTSKRWRLRFNRPQLITGWYPYYYAGWFITAISFFSYAISSYVGYRAIGSIMLLSILTVASFANRGPILFAALLCTLVWNFFFIPPTFTFFINSPDDMMMVVSFFVAALVSGFLTSRIRRQEGALETRESESRQLYDLVKALAEVKTEDQIVKTLNDSIGRQFKAESSMLLVDEKGKLNIRKILGRRMDDKEIAVARWCFENKKSAGWSTQTLSASKCICVPMSGNTGLVGVVAFFPFDREKKLSPERENLLETIISQTAIALERLRFTEAANSAKLYAVSEQLHQTLLNSVSHELRTPITALIGSASALKDGSTMADQNTREVLTDEVIAAAKRLDRVVENLLDVSRIEKGTLQVKREWFEVGDLILLLKAELKEDLKGRVLNVIGDTSVLIEGDVKLLDHAFSQIVLNAIKYSAYQTPLEIEVKVQGQQIKILVRDQGPGIAEGHEQQIFEKFHRIPGTPAGGLGLGLSIVKSLVEIHGGEVFARNRAGTQGAEFEISLPLKTPPKELQEAIQ